VIDYARFPCAVGDVVVRSDRDEEAWLAGAIVLFEGALPAACLFVAPDIAGDGAVYARARPDEALGWLSPVLVEVGREPPSAIEIEGVRFDRARRLPMRVERDGDRTPDLGSTVIVGEYTAPGGLAAIVLAGRIETLAWRGVKLAHGEYDVWRGGAK
jgi:hypothetical protein